MRTLAKTKTKKPTRFICSVRKDGESKVIGVTAKSKDEAEDKAEEKGYTVKSIHAEDEELELLGSEEEGTEEEEETQEEEEDNSEEEEEEEENGKSKSKSKGKRKSDTADDEEEGSEDSGEEEEQEEDTKPDGRSFAGRWLGN